MTRLATATATEDQLTLTLSRVAMKLNVRRDALQTLAKRENWAEAPGADQCIWVGEGNPRKIAQAALEDITKAASVDKPAPNEGRGAPK